MEIKQGDRVVVLDGPATEGTVVKVREDSIVGTIVTVDLGNGRKVNRPVSEVTGT